MVVMDSATLLLLFHPSANPPLDAVTGKPIEKCQERIEFLIENLSKAGIRIMVPTPVLSEILVKAGPDKSRILDELTNSVAFRVQSFDEVAAIEVAMLTDADLQSGKVLSDLELKAKVKYDRQIIAMAKVAGVKTIYTDDAGLTRRASANGIVTVAISDLQVRPVPPQGELPLRDTKTEGEQHEEQQPASAENQRDRSPEAHADDPAEAAQAGKASESQ